MLNYGCEGNEDGQSMWERGFSALSVVTERKTVRKNKMTKDKIENIAFIVKHELKSN